METYGSAEAPPGVSRDEIDHSVFVEFRDAVDRMCHFGNQYANAEVDDKRNTFKFGNSEFCCIAWALRICLGARDGPDFYLQHREWFAGFGRAGLSASV